MVERFSSPYIRSKLEFGLLVTHEEKTFFITNDAVNELLPRNHIEADTRIILEATKSDNLVIIRSADTDVLMPMCYAHQEKDIQIDWLMMIDNTTYVSIKEIRSYYGNEICSVLPAYHIITGCDTTSYPANVGKIKPLQKMINNASTHLLYDFGNSENSFRDLSDSLRFYQTIMYNGKLNETITDTRVRMFQVQNTKSNVNLISDKASIIQHLLRADLQTFIWKSCMLQNITIPSLEGRGWKESEGSIIPVWFEGDQFPPVLSRSKNNVNSKKKNRKSSNKESSRKRKLNPHQELSTTSRSYEYYHSSSSETVSSGTVSSETVSSGWEVWKEEDLKSTSSSDNDPDW